MKKLFYTITLGLFALTALRAQDEGLFMHYLIDPTMINPAYAGDAGKYQLFAHYRAQLSGFEGAPQTYALSFNAPMGDKLGLGAEILSENISFFNRFMGQLSYAYHYNEKGLKAGIGFATSFSKTRLNGDVSKGYNFNANDYVAQDAMSGSTFFDASVGANALFDDRIFVSISSPNLIRARLGSIAGVGHKDTSTLFKQYIAYGGYIFKKDQYTFEPSLQIRKLYQSPFEVDFNAKISIMDDRFTGAITYRPGSSGLAGFMVGVKQDNFKFYYTYSSSLAQINNYSSSAHELTLGIEFAKKDKKFQRKKTYRN